MGVKSAAGGVIPRRYGAGAGRPASSAEGAGMGHSTTYYPSPSLCDRRQSAIHRGIEIHNRQREPLGMAIRSHPFPLGSNHRNGRGEIQNNRSKLHQSKTSRPYKMRECEGENVGKVNIVNALCHLLSNFGAFWAIRSVGPKFVKRNIRYDGPQLNPILSAAWLQDKKKDKVERDGGAGLGRSQRHGEQNARNSGKYNNI